MSSQPLNAGSHEQLRLEQHQRPHLQPPSTGDDDDANGNINVDVSANSCRSSRKNIIHACQSIFIFAAVAASAAALPHQVAAFSTTPLTTFNTNTISRTNASFKNPSFVTRASNEYITGSGSGSFSTTAIFTAKSEPKTKAKKKKSDEDEWNALLAAFQMYKAAYGDLKVPSRFVVPAMPPWPENGWGLKLGQRVAAIRSTGKFVEGDDDRRKVLDDMGFLWRLRAPSPDKNMDVSFDQIYDALVTYRQEIQDDKTPLSIPSNFIVPNYDPWPEATRGMPLGKKIPTVRSKAYLKANPGATEKLSEIGFQFDGKIAANDARFNNVFSALVRYKQLNGDLLVPQPFIVPDKSKDWDEEFWGLRLGARVNAIRSQGTFVKSNPIRREMLGNLGFEWELPSSGKKRGRKKKAENEALAGPAPPGLLDGGVASDQAIVGIANEETTSVSSPDTFDESVFQIGQGESAPTWGFEDEEAEQKAQLQQQAAEEEFKPPKNLNVTLEEAAKMAISVGVIESLGQGKRVTKGSINKKIPWFNDDFGDDFVFEDIVEALTLYKGTHNSLDNLGRDFVVPEPSYGSDFDIEASAEAAAAIAKAESMGEDSDALIAAEIERMELEMAAEADAGEDEVEKVKWPEHLAGMKLGSITSRIRDGSLEVKHLPDRKKQLDKIGFDWGDERKFLDVPFEKSMCAMFAYFLIRGDLFVYEDFVMPGDKPWPTALAGLELGKAVKRIRELQNFFEAYHPEKVQLLRRVEFVWFPELALPLNPEEGPESWEDTFVEGMGHPFYQMNEPSVETIERLQTMHFGDDNDGEAKTKTFYDYNEVSEFWERGDITDVGKESERPDWRPAEWLWFNGFDQLSKEHEDHYGTTAGLDMMRLIEQYDRGEVTEKKFDELGKAAILKWEEEQLRSEAISAGIEVFPDDTMESIIERVKNDPQFEALEDDPEYKKMIEAEIDADEAREAMLLKMAEDMEEAEEVEVASVEEEVIEEEDEEYEYEYEEEEEGVKKVDDDDDDDDDVEYTDDDDDDDIEVEEEEEDDDFGVDQEEL